MNDLSTALTEASGGDDRGSRRLLILGCSQRKRTAAGPLPAIDRYDGSPYRVLRKYLRENEWPDGLSVAVLSAKYGLVGGFTGIDDYDERMTRVRAEEWSASCRRTLGSWAGTHDSIHLSLGEDYLPAVQAPLDLELQGRAEVFKGPIGMKLNQIKGLLERSGAPARHRSQQTAPGSGKVTYFLPDWDDLLDENFDFATDTFSGSSRSERGDKHCCTLMQPKRMCDGVLVSLAQHVTSKGPLRRIMGTEATALAPKNLRQHFGLATDQSLFGDCGAFSYVNEDEPAIGIEQALALYDLHGFDFGASVDHIPVPAVVRGGIKVVLSTPERQARVDLTKANAAAFFDSSKRRSSAFTPVGTVQALSPDDYAANVRLYHEMGYRHIAIGGLVPLPDLVVSAVVEKVMAAAAGLIPRPWVHLFGVFRPKLQARFRELGVDSFDSATYFRKAWLRSDQNYLSPSGKWYAALRVPMTTDGRTRKRLNFEGVSADELAVQEAAVMALLGRYEREEVQVQEVLDAVIEYDVRLTRTHDARSMRAKYEQTLRDRPWKSCDCPFCSQAGIHVLIFRGANRNKRRGAHNTLMLYGMVAAKARC